MKSTQARVQAISDSDRCPVCLGLQGHWHHKAEGGKKWISCSLCKGTGKKKFLGS